MAGSNIEFLGFVNNKELSELYQNAKAFIFPQIEDFGITPLEAMATGCPVIAHNQGGALETVIDNKTGIFFDEQTPESLAAAITRFNKNRFDPEKIRNHASGFDIEVFNSKILEYLEKKWEHWQKEMIN